MKPENKKTSQKYSAFVKFKGESKGKQEFSKSLKRLSKLILVERVVSVEITVADSSKSIMTLTKKIH